jgi:hypothetical protein
VADPAPVAWVQHQVVRVPQARWLRWVEGRLEVGDGAGRVYGVVVPAEALTLVGRAFEGLSRPQGQRVAVAARFPAGATVLVDFRGGRCAVAASPQPSPRRGARPAAPV